MPSSSTGCQRPHIDVSTRNRNVPVLSEIEMSPFLFRLVPKEKPQGPVGAVRNASARLAWRPWAFCQGRAPSTARCCRASNPRRQG